VTIEKVDNPARFQLTDEPVRLVIGWRADEQGGVTPLLAGGSPGGTASSSGAPSSPAEADASCSCRAAGHAPLGTAAALLRKRGDETLWE